MNEQTSAACDCKLDCKSVKVKLRGKVVESAAPNALRSSTRRRTQPLRAMRLHIRREPRGV
jgi:hypothetical protein